MTPSIAELLTELERFGDDNDRTVAGRPRRMLNITRDTGELLSVLVRATRARRILEIGTSNGYSTLWLALAAQAIGGHVTTVERSDFKVGLAAENFDRSGLRAVVTQIHAEGGVYLKESPASRFDLVFLDSERSEYPSWWADTRRVLCKGGLLVADNAVSHAAEMQPFVALVSSDPEFTSCTVPVGKGEFLATRERRPDEP